MIIYTLSASLALREKEQESKGYMCAVDSARVSKLLPPVIRGKRKKTVRRVRAPDAVRESISQDLVRPGIVRVANDRDCGLHSNQK